MKIIIFLSLIAASLNVFAAPQKTETKLKSYTNKASDKKFTLEFLIATEQTKQIVNKRHDGAYTKYDASLLQHLSPNDELRYFLATRAISSKDSDMNEDFTFFFGELMYRRKNILTETDNNIYMEAELKNYRLMDTAIKKRYGYDGAIIPQLIFKKRLTRKFSTKLKLRRHIYQKNNNDNYTLNAEDRVYLYGTYFINRGLMFSSNLKYQHKMRTGSGPDYRFMELAEFNPRTRSMDLSKVPTAKKSQELLTLHSGLLFMLNRKAMLETYIETKLANSYDNRDLKKIAEDEAVFGAALYLTAF